MIPEAGTGFSKRRGVGCCGYRHFILGHLIERHIMWWVDKTQVDKMLADKMQVKTVREDKILHGHILGQGGQNADLIKTLNISY